MGVTLRVQTAEGLLRAVHGHAVPLFQAAADNGAGKGAVDGELGVAGLDVLFHGGDVILQRVEVGGAEAGDENGFFHHGKPFVQ